MTQEDVENHRKNLVRLDDQVRRIVEPRVVDFERFKTAMAIKREILRRMSHSGHEVRNV